MFNAIFGLIDVGQHAGLWITVNILVVMPLAHLGVLSFTLVLC